MAKTLFDNASKDKESGGADVEVNRSQVLEQFQQTIEKVANTTGLVDSEKLFKELMEVRLPDIESLNKASQKDVSLVVKALNELFKKLGLNVEGLTTYAPMEARMIKESSASLEIAKQNAKEAEEVKENWWNNFWGIRIKNINKTKKAVGLAIAADEEIKQKVEIMRTQRIENFTVNEAGLDLVEYSRKAEGILGEKVKEGEQLRQVLEGHRVYITKMIEESSTKLKERVEKRDEAKVELDAAVIILQGVKDIHSEEYVEAMKNVSDLQSIWDEANDKVKEAEAVMNSKQYHLPNIMTRLTALVEQIGNLRALRKKLKSDTESMVEEIKADLQLLKNSRAQEGASALEEVGVAYTDKNQKMAAQITGASAADHLKRLQMQPERVINALNTAEALEKLKDSIAEKANRLREAASLAEAYTEAEKQRAEEKGSGSNGSTGKGYTSPVQPTSQPVDSGGLLD